MEQPRGAECVCSLVSGTKLTHNNAPVSIFSATPLNKQKLKKSWTSYNDRSDTGDGSDTGSVKNLFGYRSSNGSPMNWGDSMVRDQRGDLWVPQGHGRKPNIDRDGGMEEKDCVRIVFFKHRYGDLQGPLGGLDNQRCDDTQMSEHFCEHAFVV